MRLCCGSFTGFYLHKSVIYAKACSLLSSMHRTISGEVREQMQLCGRGRDVEWPLRTWSTCRRKEEATAGKIVLEQCKETQLRITRYSFLSWWHFIFFCLLGHIQWCSGRLLPVFEPRNHSWRLRGAYGILGLDHVLAKCKATALPVILSFQPNRGEFYFPSYLQVALSHFRSEGLESGQVIMEDRRKSISRESCQLRSSGASSSWWGTQHSQSSPSVCAPFIVGIVYSQGEAPSLVLLCLFREISWT